MVQKAIEIHHQIPIEFVDVELDKALEIAARLNIYAYDAYVIQCAIQTGAPLLSLDHALLQNAKSTNLTVLEV